MADKTKKEHNTVSLSTLGPAKGSRKRKVRVGRGIGSKLGKTAGSGNKGQKSRRGYSRRRGFEGGQMPLHRRIPKRGFHNPFSTEYSVINLEELNVFPAGETVTPELLRAHGFVSKATGPIKVKVTADGVTGADKEIAVQPEAGTELPFGPWDLQRDDALVYKAPRR